MDLELLLIVDWTSKLTTTTLFTTQHVTDHFQNATNSSLVHTLPVHKISQKSTENSLSYCVNKQTNRDINGGQKRTSSTVTEVKKNWPTEQNSLNDKMWLNKVHCFLWSPYGIGQTIIFSSCSFFLSSSSFFFFPRLISAVGDWMSTILLHMAWP